MGRSYPRKPRVTSQGIYLDADVLLLRLLNSGSEAGDQAWSRSRGWIKLWASAHAVLRALQGICSPALTPCVPRDSFSETGDENRCVRHPLKNLLMPYGER